MNILHKDIAGYQLTDHLGSGGMGDVYKGYNPVLRRTAAIKVLHLKDLAERFQNEAAILASLSHPNIAQFYEFVAAAEAPCLIMEYVEGIAIDACIRKKGRLTSAETERILRQVASALAYLHQGEVLHRDIKPQNFKIQPDGTVKMLDFGIAKNKYTPKFTQLGFAVGTTEYMAPEQFQHGAEKASDMWSLGVMTYEMLTGYLPFEATDPVTLRSKITRTSFTDPRLLAPGIAPVLCTILERCLKANPAARLSATELTALLAGDNPPSAKSPQSPPGFQRQHLFLALFLLAAALTFTLFRSTGRAVENPPPTEFPPAPAEEKHTSPTRHITITAAGIDNAVIVFPDGTRKPLPYQLKGKDGDHFDFTIEAQGYESLNVPLDINTRRRSYDYRLVEKQKP